jgi:diguanylate cyclase (GGDEF)-like protein
MLNTVRETDFVIRFGGEEFLILLVDCDRQASREMAERLRQNVEAYKFHIPGLTVRITLSIGTAAFTPPYNSDIWNVFKFADTALYQAKENGRNQIIRHEESVSTAEQLDLPE